MKKPRNHDFLVIFSNNSEFKNIVQHCKIWGFKILMFIVVFGLCCEMRITLHKGCSTKPINFVLLREECVGGSGLFGGGGLVLKRVWRGDWALFRLTHVMGNAPLHIQH